MQGMHKMVTETSLKAARSLLVRVPLIDGHNDLAWIIHSRARGDFSRFDPAKLQPDHDTDLVRLKQGQVAMQIFAAFIPTLSDHPARTTIEVIDIIRRMEATYPHLLQPVRIPQDFQRARILNKIGSMIGVEGGVGLEGSLSVLRLWYAAGARLMTLCHNESLDWVDSATDAPLNQGLSEFGKSVITELNSLGMIIDLSHTAPSVMHQVLDMSTKPVIWSHSNAMHLCDHPRNVPDDVLNRVTQNGGLVMATFVPDFVSQASRNWHRPLLDAYGKVPFERWETRAAEEAALELTQGPCPRATIEQYCDHVEYLARRCGIDHVGIGSDFFGGTATLGLEDVSRFPAIFAELLGRGWDEEALTKLAGGNFLRVWQDVVRP
jgi:membrane dipeptidase